MKQGFAFRLWVAVLLTTSLTACAGLKEYKAAQESFNQGASLEMSQRNNQMRTSLPASPDLEKMFPSAAQPNPTLKPDHYYRTAYDQINKALKSSPKLKSSDVLGEALVIKSLACWKLKKYDESREASRNAAEELSMEQDAGARDKALMAAMSGLIAIDLAYDTLVKMNELLRSKAEHPQQTSTEQAMAIYDRGRMNFEEFVFSRQVSRNSIWQGIQIIDEAKTKAEPSHEIQRYLLMAQLSGFKSWTDALEAIDNTAKRLGAKRNDAVKGWIEGQKDFYRTTRNTYLEKLALLAPNGKTDPMYLSWEKIL